MLDNSFTLTIILSSIAVIGTTLYFIIVLLRDILKKERVFNPNGLRGAQTLILSIFLLGGIAYCYYNIPRILFNGYSWGMIYEMGPESLLRASVFLWILIIEFFIYFILNAFFVKKDDKPYFLIVILSIVSGFGNSLMVFIINEALNRTLNDESRRAGIESGLYWYFILGFFLYTLCAYIVRKKLIILTNSIIYNKRIEIINRILKAPFHKFESLETGKIHAALNNDSENVSGFVNVMVNIITGSISVAVCFIYLGTLDPYGCLLSIVIIVVASALFLKVSQSAEQSFQKNRDVLNLFFKNINDLICGFKELFINKEKSRGFSKDIQKSCEIYRDTRIEGDSKFIGVSIMGEFLYMFVIGIVVFTFPLIFKNIQDSTLRTYVLVYLYMGGIITMLTGLIPGLVRMMVSWKRINSFIGEIATLEVEKELSVLSESVNKVDIELKGVEFQYKNQNGERFILGPVNCQFKSGEIVFISGGNGCGKSTLAKLITGLYIPDEGDILINNRQVDSEAIGSYFTTVYSEFHLFDRLYGIDCEEKKEEIREYLNLLRIEDKVHIKGDRFNTIKLSTGQRKRLALLISYLEDRPAYFFDEWAADQDPEFKRFFYTKLLPELKAKGKTIIAITHDDSYFSYADKLIQMDTGKITEVVDMSEIEETEFESA
jgi:putative ATP-binding cassette transporter